MRLRAFSLLTALDTFVLCMPVCTQASVDRNSPKVSRVANTSQSLKIKS